MKYYGKFTDSHDLITVAKGESIAVEQINNQIGDTIHNVPSGGSTGQVLSKVSDNNYDLT